MSLTGNKGEWSEVYAFLKLMGDKEVKGGDGHLSKIENLVYPIIKILRTESNDSFEFSYSDKLVIVQNQSEEFRIPIVEFQKQASLLLNKLKEKTKGTFSLPVTEQFLKKFGSSTIKAKSTVKSDIIIQIHDSRTGASPQLGFSIKSKLGSPSTLLNAGKTTNFIFKIEDVVLNHSQINQINNINSRSKIKDRTNAILNYGCSLKFVKTAMPIFENNLVLIDSSLPQILSEIVFLFYSSEISKLSELVEEITLNNPLEYNTIHNHPFYNYKIKKFLTEVALGMMPSKIWDGVLDATGGHLVVKEDGEVLCYHIYDKNQFEDYLFNDTKLDTASSNRHGFGSVYEKNGEQFFKLNLQIRFL